MYSSARISKIFRKRKTIKRVKLPDKVLLQRMAVLVLLLVVYLVVWCAMDPPRADVYVTLDGLKFHMCTKSPWYWALYTGEIGWRIWWCQNLFILGLSPWGVIIELYFVVVII